MPTCVLHISAEIDPLSALADGWARENAEQVVFARDVYEACVRAARREPSDVDVILLHAAGLSRPDFQIVRFAAHAWPAARRIVYGDHIPQNAWLELAEVANSLDSLRRLLEDEPAEAFATALPTPERVAEPARDSAAPPRDSTPAPASATIGRDGTFVEPASHSLAQHEIDVLFGVMPR